MAYITTTDLNNRLGEMLYARLTDRDGGSQASAAVAQEIVDQAEAVANSYLAVRYATPVDVSAHAELAAILRARVLDLAENRAWQTSPFVNDVPGRIRALAGSAAAWFESVARGDVHLPSAAPVEGRTAEDDAPRYVAVDRTFTADELDGL